MSDARHVGRPLGFAPDDVLWDAMGTFWERGFEGTSLQDLESRTGIGRSSLYNAFGNKHDLYLKALSLYIRRLEELMFSPLENGTMGIDDIHAFFERLRTGLAPVLGAPATARGCMLINGMVEFGGSDPELALLSDEFCRRFLSSMTLALQRASRRREIDRDGIDAKARLLLAIALGVNVTSRSRASAQEIGSLLDAANGLVSSWRRS